MTDLVHSISSHTIQPNDLVIVYEGHNQLKSLKLCSNSILHNRYGVFDHNNIIGKPYGSKIYNRTNTSYIIILRCTSELWTLVLAHRTQIIYVADISYICYMLDLKPGSIVYESGTGSGSLSTSIIKHISPTGYLYTYEYNVERVQKAIHDFVNLGLYNELVSVYHCDAVKHGFPPLKHNNTTIGVDAIFLDLPTPWLCIDNCTRVLKHGGRICCFSPCIEQTQKTCLALSQYKYQQITTVEILIANYEINRNTVIEPDFGQSTANQQNNDTTTVDAGHNDTDETKDDHNNDEATDTTSTAELKSNNKRSIQPSTNKQQKRMKYNSSTISGTMLVSRPYPDQRGHTAYLTFATCYKD